MSDRNRERLKELICNAPRTDVVYDNIKLPYPTQTLPLIVDHLIANNVVAFPCNVGDKVAVRALCECVYTLPVFEECRNECPFEDDCPCEECDNSNERIFVTRVDRIFSDGNGWKFEFRYLGIEASENDLGVSFFVGEDAEQQAAEYEQALKERE